MLLPSKIKHRKWHAPRRANKGLSYRMNTLAYGSFGLRALTPAWVTSRQIEAARRVLTRYVRRGGKIWIRVFPDRPVTKKGNELPMGGGKGSPEHFVCTVKPGMVLFEMDGVPADDAMTAMNEAAYKLPLKAKVIHKEVSG